MSYKILHIMNYAAAYRGNFIDSLEKLDEELIKTGSGNVYLFTKDAKNEKAYNWIKEMETRGKKVYFLNENVVQDMILIKKIIKQNQIDFIHTHFITMNQYLSIYLATFARKIKVLMHMHNHSRSTENKLKSYIRQKLYSKCTMIACSGSVLKSLERDYPENYKIAIDNGVNFSRLDNFQQISKQDFELDKDSKVCLVFGFDFYRKGVDLAIKALNELQKKGVNISLLISLSTNFEQVNKEIIDILGEHPSWIKVIPARNDVATLYNFVDVFLSPSREEGLPYSVIEAAYSKCVIALSDISAQANLKITHAKWFENENIAGLEAAILSALELHEDKKEKWDTVKKAIIENYGLNEWVSKVINIYDNISEL